ncbi:MAG: hypothetical protein HYX51_06315, partial [Chloroflexi bacterium]|nr:hypothetical protein [Chloroflexota bacterium]
LARAWMDADATTPFADDIAASVLRVLGRDSAVILDLAERVFRLNRGRRSRPVLERSTAPHGPETPPAPDVLAMIYAYAGMNPRARIDGDGFALTFSKETWQDRPLLRIAISYQPDPANDNVVTSIVPEETTMLSADAYLATFLTAEAFPAGFKMWQDSRTRGPDPGDAAFRQYGGLQSGGARWGPADERLAPINRIIDVRWLFPTAQAATAYHRATLQANAEGMSLVQGAPALGTDCHAFRWDAGWMSAQITGRHEPSYTCMYLFTVGPVVVKFFAAGGFGEHPTLEETYAIARHIPPRILAATGTAGGGRSQSREAVAGEQAGRPWWRRLFS